jgi:hypothetical protein
VPIEQKLGLEVSISTNIHPMFQYTRLKIGYLPKWKKKNWNHTQITIPAAVLPDPVVDSTTSPAPFPEFVSIPCSFRPKKYGAQRFYRANAVILGIYGFNQKDGKRIFPH